MCSTLPSLPEAFTSPDIHELSRTSRSSCPDQRYEPAETVEEKPRRYDGSSLTKDEPVTVAVGRAHVRRYCHMRSFVASQDAFIEHDHHEDNGVGIGG